uniref:Cadherin EGF LAG seven-pass G-type receptor 3-like n=1 Tax=Sinocyclocheilus rhinocerous TaxID=307959 RepID=A0A673HI73_9TELE
MAALLLDLGSLSPLLFLLLLSSLFTVIPGSAAGPFCRSLCTHPAPGDAQIASLPDGTVTGALAGGDWKIHPARTVQSRGRETQCLRSCAVEPPSDPLSPDYRNSSAWISEPAAHTGRCHHQPLWSNGGSGEKGVVSRVLASSVQYGKKRTIQRTRTHSRPQTRLDTDRVIAHSVLDNCRTVDSISRPNHCPCHPKREFVAAKTPTRPLLKAYSYLNVVSDANKLYKATADRPLSGPLNVIDLTREGWNGSGIRNTRGCSEPSAWQLSLGLGSDASSYLESHRIRGCSERHPDWHSSNWHRFNISLRRYAVCARQARENTNTTSSNNNSKVEFQEYIEEQTGVPPVGRSRRAANRHPHFPQYNYQVQVAENQPPGTSVITMTAEDPDAGEAGRLSYSMAPLMNSRSMDYFQIDPITGLLTTTHVLDREHMDLHYFRVTATDHGSPRLSGTTMVTITVADRNDHSPVFEQTEYRETIRENVEEGYPILQLRATDLDSPANANIRYRFIGESAAVARSAFEIDPRSGLITTRGIVDREANERYTLLVEASDQGREPGPRSATVSVHITVLDENDNVPQFSQKRYVVAIREDVRPHSEILRVSASDQDKDGNAALHYNIISGNSRGQFAIDSVTGEIQVVAPLDFETEREYTLRLRAQDNGRPPLSNNTGIVSVQVTDVNDNPPIFVSTPFQATVLESAPIGHSILHIQAIDTDNGDNARLEYRLTGTGTDTPFVINAATGWVTVSSELDRESVEHYFFGVEARDYGAPPLSVTASVTITVMDVNDNRPEFLQKEYYVRLNEDAAVGTSVFSVTAVDRDVNSAVTYQITGGNTRNRFAISTASGAGLVSLALPLDYKQERRYVLTVTASDRTLHDTCQVHINITDANTHRPVFQSAHYSVSVNEDRPPGSTVVVISATDDDVGENARITYYLEDNIPQFRIDPASGAITLQAELDYEDQMTYTLAITARDNGIPQKSDTTYVEVNVNDVNDNAPQFLSPRYQGGVSEDAPPFTSVLQISATDRDAHANGRVQYTFQNGEDGDGDFTIEPTSGIVRTVRRLDRESVPFYELTAFAVDRGVPPQRTPVHIQVSVMDVNDNAPVFPADDFEVLVKENSAVGSVVAQITATDPDEGPNAQIMYQIVEGNIPEIFQMDIFSGELTSLIDLDYETRNEYVIVVQATSAPLVSRATVRIRLVDQNDNGPQMQEFQIIFNNFVSNRSNTFPSGVIGRVPAHDPDVSDHLYYTIDRGNDLHLLLLNHTSGEIRLSRKLDNNRPLVAPMLVTVTDGIHSVSAQCVLRVLIITEEMLSSSITVRLQNMSQEHFLSPLLTHFLEGVSAVLSVSPDDVFVFNVQPDAGKVLNVSFSAALPGGQFFPSEALEEQLYLNRPRLNALAHMEVLPFDDNVCLREPCQNYMKCISILRFNSSAPFIASPSTLFRPIHPITGLRCRCPAGFTGDYCEIEINLCYSNPCMNGGVCARREGGYTCICREDYTGERCEFDRRGGQCVAGICRNGGTCRELSGGGFRCECPAGGYEKPYCSVTTRSFPPKSFMMFRGLRQRFHLSISLSFATLESNGLLFYNGRFNEKHDFLALEILDGQMSSTQVSPYLPDRVSDGSWHTVHIHYYNKPKRSVSGDVQGPSDEKVAVLSVDDCDTAVSLRFGAQLGNYSCAAQGRQTSSKKSLDLTGPLFLGGVPNLPENFPFSTREFIGCMKDLHIDNRPVDMAGFIANNGTLPGCSAKLPFCKSNPCQNGGTCRESWETYSCDCPVGFGGKDCSLVMSHPHRFLGNSALWWDLKNEVSITTPWYMGLVFRTRSKEGVLLQAQAGQYTNLIFQVVSGQLVFSVARGSTRPVRLRLDQVQVCDGRWHDLQLDVMSGVAERLDILLQSDWTLDCIRYTHTLTHLTPIMSLTDCYNPITLTLKKVLFCNSLHFSYTGFYGKSCMDACQLNPCENQAKCHRKPSSSHGYICDCEDNHYGQIEQQCPLGWWGSPTCGPCHCEASKGFDTDCNKTTGHCHCKEFHYRRRGSDICLPCDCYPVGSFSRSCDPESGQCQCRPGVIGRQCNMCDNPFAEVTQPGCEVIYDGCPKTITSAIWWPRTKFNLPAAVPCPKGSVGTAIRHCDGERGWLDPDLYNCTSPPFVELNTALEALERNETELNTIIEKKLAHQLRDVTEATTRLYGNDLQIAERLLSRLLTFESLQSGFGLTATQDAHFNEVSCSVLLSPGSAALWRGQSSGQTGVAGLADLFEQYTRILAQNMKQTYLNPVALVAPNIGQHQYTTNTYKRTGGCWTVRDCSVVYRNTSHVRCQCHRLGTFGVLMDSSQREGDLETLAIVTYSSLSVSMAALLLTVVVLSCLRGLKSNTRSIHSNMAAATLLSHLTYLLGINQTEQQFLCTVVAILLHYFFMSSFAWLFVEALHIYRMQTEARNINYGAMRFYYAIGWGVPAIITGLAVGLDPEGYGNADFCWISMYDKLMWSFAGPVSVVLLVLCSSVSTIRSAFLLLLLSTCVWLFGLMAVNNSVLAFHYLFIVLCCVQVSVCWLLHISFFCVCLLKISMWNCNLLYVYRAKTHTTAPPCWSRADYTESHSELQLSHQSAVQGVSTHQHHLEIENSLNNLYLDVNTF